MSHHVARLSKWIDDSYGDIDEETALWRRCTKVASESGEVIDALAGMVGENPRKGVTGTSTEVIKELLDVAVAALGAVEHMTGNNGISMSLFHQHLGDTLARAGVALDEEARRGPVS